MRKTVLCLLLLAAAITLNAVPAYRGWQTRTQADGSTIDIQQVGDEFYHYMINRDGQQVELNDAGMYEVVANAPSPAKIKARHDSNKARRVRKQFGVTPNLAPRGIVIMVNFANKAFAEEHTQAVFDSLCNAFDCKVNKQGKTLYPSAAQYFSDQSNGAYRPVFDVYGPVTLENDYDFYGKNDPMGNDARAANMIVEACKLADEQFGVDFKLYDSDEDGHIDFVYVIYAGKGEASGGAKNTIWPHSYSIEEQFAYEQYYSAYPEEFEGETGKEFFPYFMDQYPTEDDCYVDGKMVNTYACSNELMGSNLDGIGTLCHEFGHVMGLPDFYDTDYGQSYSMQLTPSEWDVMDGGAYNGDGHCPPNYSAWEKYFFGWHTPVNPGSKGQNLKLVANGLEGYQAYQITSGDELIGPTDSLPKNETVYYIENRQKVGWDRGLPEHGMLIWRVNYSETAWTENMPNNDYNSIRYTLVCNSGEKVGADYASKNIFPSGLINSWKGIAAKPLKEITETDGIISLVYIEKPPFTVTWMVNGEVFETQEYANDGSEDLRFPSAIPNVCDEGTHFIGWTTETQWFDPFTLPEDLFNEPEGKVTQDITYTAMFTEKPIPLNIE